MRLQRPFVVASVILVLFAAHSAFAGGAITSGTTVAGTLSGPSYLESWTFSGSSGQRVLINAVTTSGNVDTNIILKAPGGAVLAQTTVDQVDYQIATNGTFTIEISDAGLNDAGTYSIAFTNITAGPLAGGGDSDGGPIVSADVVTGTMSGAADMDCFTFTGSTGQRVLMVAVATAGASFNTVVVLYPPAGGAYLTYTFADRLETPLNANGTWTIVVYDNGFDTAGSYSLSLLNVTGGPLENLSDTDGEPIASNDIKTGQFQQGVDFDAFTFTGVAGNRILFRGLATGAGGHNPTLSIYPPGGGQAEASTSSDGFDLQLLKSGTYTVVVEDTGNDNTGTYTISMMNVTSGPYTGGGDNDGGTIISAEVKSGTISGVADMDCFTFTGNVGQRVVMDAIATAGASFNTTISLFSPQGGPYATYTFGDRLEFQLTSTGIWSIVIEDNANDTAGSYQMSFLNVTGGPLENVGDTDGESIVSNQIKTGQFQQAVDFDAFTFSGTAGHRMYFTSLATGGGGHNPTLSIYPPNGGVAEASTSTDGFDVLLLQTGTYTVVVEDTGNDNAGTYVISMFNLTAGPYTDGLDTNGGPITSADVKSGTLSGPGDLDCFTFTGTIGQRVIMDAIVTSGATFNTAISLYPPNGGPNATYTFGDRLEFQLTATGTWTVIICDDAFDAAGGYSMSFMNISGGPLENGSDTDGEGIASNDIKNGTLQQGVDFDAFTFTGTLGHRILFTSFATGGGGHNPTLSVYPPNGGVAEASTSADGFDFMLQQTGTYTVVVEDTGNDNPGTYVISMFDLTAGPYTSPGDLDGGPIVSADIKSGTMSGIGDVDCYTFAGTIGQRVLIDAIATAGAGFNTVISLYPPNGGANATYTFADRLEYQLTASGTWTIVIEDNATDTAGSYQMSLMNITGGPLENGGDTDGEVIVSNDIKSGQLQQPVDFDAFTFTVVGANRRLLFTSLAMGGAAHNPNLSVYPPGGGAAIVSTSADQFDVLVPSAGTYTLIVEDSNNDNAGAYTISMVNVNTGPFTNGSDPNGGLIASNGIVTGTMSGPADVDGYQFQGFNGNRVLVSAVATGGADFNTLVALYPPNGGPAATYTFGDRLEFQLTSSGVWTIIVEDNGYDGAGNYSLSFLNATQGPYSGGPDSDGGNLIEGVARNGSAVAVADFDGYTFYGLFGQTATITATTTSGLMNTNISLYPPGGGAAVFSTSGDVINPVLTFSGYYTVVIEDVLQDETGNYTLTLDLSGSGPTDVGDTPPAQVALLPASPSPFSSSTRLGFELPSAGDIELRVFDVRGARVRTLLSEGRPAGVHSIDWDGRDDHGARVASGVYYVQLRAPSATVLRKVVLVR